MADLFKFQQGDDEDCSCDQGCPVCSIIDDHLQIALECESEEELHGLLASLFSLAHDFGYNDALEDRLSANLQALEERRNGSMGFDF